MKAYKLADVVQWDRLRIFTKDTARPVKLGGLSKAAKDLAPKMGDDDLLAVGRTTAPRAKGEVLVDREVALVLRKEGGVWRIYEKAGE
jgi:hypothetical protein